MHKGISLALKIISMLFLILAAIVPSLSGSVSTEWVDDQPPNSPNNFNGKILEFGVFTFKANELKYNNDTNDFYLTPIATNNKTDPFIQAMTGFQKLLQITFLISLALIFYTTKIHWRRSSKFASFLLLLGIFGIVFMMFLLVSFQVNALAALAANGGTIVGNTVVIDRTVEVNNVNYIWRTIVSVKLEGGVIFMGISAITAFASLFFKGDYDIETIEYINDEFDYNE